MHLFHELCQHLLIFFSFHPDLSALEFLPSGFKSSSIQFPIFDTFYRPKKPSRKWKSEKAGVNVGVHIGLLDVIIGRLIASKPSSSARRG